MFNTKAIAPTMLKPESRFKFRCHPEIKCFTRCCSDIDILLTPYDILRMKNRLGVSSEIFLERFTRSYIDKKSSLPHVFIQMRDDANKSCPFVTPEGCTIYTDRPVACRYYPVGQATHRIEDGEKVANEEFFVLVKEKHCLGFSEDREWTIEEWRHDQDAAHYDDMNRSWKDMLMRRGGLPGLQKMNEKRQKQFFIASYDLDRFKRYVFESRFLEVVEVDAETLNRINSDEVALMHFGFDYLKFLLGMEQTIKVRDGALPKPPKSGA